MKFYFDRKRNDITIIASPNEKCPSVSFVEDRYGRKPRKWEKLPRYRVHHSCIDEGYSTPCDKLYSIENAERVCLFKVTRTKKRVKL